MLNHGDYISDAKLEGLKSQITISSDLKPGRIKISDSKPGGIKISDSKPGGIKISDSKPGGLKYQIPNKLILVFKIRIIMMII